MWTNGPTGAVEWHQLAAVATAVAAVCAQVFVDRARGPWTTGAAIALNLVLAGMVWWLGDRRARSIRRAAEGARGESLMDLGHLLEPLVREVGRVSALPDTERHLERSALREAVVSAASGLSSKRLRSSYFELDAGNAAMECVRSTGRAGEPREGFSSGHKSGDAALAMVADGKWRFVPDLNDSSGHPPGWVQSNRGDYQTFISVTVGTPGNPLGMLTVDSEDAGDLTKEDLRMMIVLGHILGIAETVTA